MNPNHYASQPQHTPGPNHQHQAGYDGSYAQHHQTHRQNHQQLQQQQLQQQLQQQQHQPSLSHIPHHYPTAAYPLYAQTLPHVGTFTPIHGFTPFRVQQPGLPPGYNRYDLVGGPGGGGPGGGGPGGPGGMTGQLVQPSCASSAPYFQANATGQRRRDSMPEIGTLERNGMLATRLLNSGGVPVPGSGGIDPTTMNNAEPRMGQYMGVSQTQPSFTWHQPLVTSTQPPLEPGMRSRTSTISRTTDDEGAIGKGPSGTGTGTSEGAVSRTSSPHPMRELATTPIPQSQSNTKVEKRTEETSEIVEEEKMDHRKRKRNRTIRSCVPCHNHKRKVSWKPVKHRVGEC